MKVFHAILIMAVSITIASCNTRNGDSTSESAPDKPTKSEQAYTDTVNKQANDSAFTGNEPKVIPPDSNKK